MESLLTSNGSAALPKDSNVATTDASDSPFSPPYWQTHFTDEESSASLNRRHIRAQIQLEDHTEETSEQYKDFLWAKAVRIDGHIIVRGATPAIGAYVVWNCTVDILDVSPCRSKFAHLGSRDPAWPNSRRLRVHCHASVPTRFGPD
jgi:hypothetical protein